MLQVTSFWFLVSGLGLGFVVSGSNKRPKTTNPKPETYFILRSISLNAMDEGNLIRILVADDNFLVRLGLGAVLNAQSGMSVIAEAGNGRQAVELFRQHTPDIVLMDLRMPLMTGVEATKAIRSEYPGARIIVLTTYDGDEDIYRALQAGARAYLLKDVLREDLLAAIRAVHAGNAIYRRLWLLGWRSGFPFPILPPESWKFLS